MIKTQNTFVYKYFRKDLPGFAMMEALVAITILLVAIMAPLTLSIQSAKYAKLANDKTVASYIASDGIEFATNFRSSLILYCLQDAGISEPYCAGDPATSSLDLFMSSSTVVGKSEEQVLTCDIYQNNTTKEFGCLNGGASGYTKTLYRRKVTIVNADNFNYGGTPGYNVAVRITSVVCYTKEPVCDSTVRTAAKIISYVY